MTGRLSAGHLVMVVAALLATLVNYTVLRARDTTVRVAVAAEHIAAGQPVTAAVFGFTDVRADEDVLASLLQPDQIARVEGWVTTTPVQPGAVVRASDLRAPSAPRAQRAMSVPIDPAHAVGGALRTGDRVDVIEVREGSARYLVTDAEVLAVPDPAGGSALGTALRTFSITLAVDDETALRLAIAIRDGHLEVVRSTGAARARVRAVTPASAATDQDADSADESDAGPSGSPGAPDRDGGTATSGES